MYHPGTVAMSPYATPRSGSNGVAVTLAVTLWLLASGSYLLGLLVVAFFGIWSLAVGGPTVVLGLVAVLPLLVGGAGCALVTAMPAYRDLTSAARSSVLGACCTVGVALAWGAPVLLLAAFA